jgi:hypothetical protein
METRFERGEESLELDKKSLFSVVEHSVIC